MPNDYGCVAAYQTHPGHAADEHNTSLLAESALRSVFRQLLRGHDCLARSCIVQVTSLPHACLTPWRCSQGQGYMHYPKVAKAAFLKVHSMHATGDWEAGTAQTNGRHTTDKWQKIATAYLKAYRKQARCWRTAPRIHSRVTALATVSLEPDMDPATALAFVTSSWVSSNLNGLVCRGCCSSVLQQHSD